MKQLNLMNSKSLKTKKDLFIEFIKNNYMPDENGKYEPTKESILDNFENIIIRVLFHLKYIIKKYYQVLFQHH